MNLIYVHLQEIKFIERSDQIVGYQRAVKEWMKQWSMPNNYHPVVTEVGPAMNRVVDAMRADFFSKVRYHFLSMIPDEYQAVYNYKRDFEFGFYSAPLVLGDAFYLTGAINWVAGDAK